MFVPTVYIDNDILLKLMMGEIKLKPGQWIKLAWSDHKARWVGVTPGGNLWCVHHPDYQNFKRLFDNFVKSFGKRVTPQPHA